MQLKYNNIMATKRILKAKLQSSPDKVKLLSHHGSLDKMNFRDLQRRAIVLGMPFPDVVSSDAGRLQSFIINSTNKPDMDLIDKYDDYIDKHLEELGYSKDDPIRGYSLRLGFVSQDPETKKTIKKRSLKGLSKPKKSPRERDSIGLWKGTKKSYTFELANKHYTYNRTLRRVLKKFPEANPNSVLQWWRKAIKLQGLDPKELMGDEEDEKEI